MLDLGEHLTEDEVRGLGQGHGHGEVHGPSSDLTPTPFSA